MTRERPAADPDRYPWSDGFERAIGHDPARDLDRPLGPEPGPGDVDGLERIHARIRGIRRLDVVAIYRQTEHNLAEYHDREPRDAVLDALATQESLIEEYGTLGDVLDDVDRGRDRERPPKEWEWPDRDGGDRSTTHFSSRLSITRSTRSPATDGGTEETDS